MQALLRQGYEGHTLHCAFKVNDAALMSGLPYEAPQGAKYGGEGGIRTHDPREGIIAFETTAFGHSATSPKISNEMSLKL